MIFSQEILTQKDMEQLLLSAFLGENELVEKLTYAIIVDEVGTKTKFGELAGWVSKDSLGDSFQTRHSDSVVPYIQELESRILFKGV